MNRAERNLEILRKQQAERVMPVVGAILDAWENTSNDEKAMFEKEYPHLAELIRDLNDAVEKD